MHLIQCLKIFQARGHSPHMCFLTAYNSFKDERGKFRKAFTFKLKPAFGNPGVTVLVTAEYFFSFH